MQLHVSALKTRSRPPPQKSTTHTVQSLKFSRQPDDGLHTGPKHVVAYYTGCNRRKGPNFGRVFLM